MSQPRTIVARRRLAELFAFAGTLAAIGSSAFAGPEGEQVTHGTATFSRSGADTTIHVGSHTAIINYRSFDIPRGETVRFIQPSSSSRVLNRINSEMPSQIDGTLLANGHVYLVNPSGFIFGNNALINVGKLTAAAANISDADFLRGVDRFTDVKGAVVNHGVIQAVENVTLVGRFVSNSGVIDAERAVMVAAGDDVLIGEVDGHTFVRIDAKQIAAGNEPSATAGKAGSSLNLGAGDLYSLAISNSGTIKARQARLESVRRGKVEVTGKIDASNSAGKGGRVDVLGEHVSLSGAKIDASGSAGGGDVRVGGDFRGQGGLRTASTVSTDRSTTINVDATTAGNGGTIVLWSNERTRFGASLSAKGGEQQGDGGLIEASSKDLFQFAGGRVDTSAKNGAQGQFLLDPATLTIIPGAAGGGTQDATLLGAGEILEGDPDLAANTVTWGQIQALGAAANVVLEASGLVTIADMGGGVGTADVTALSLNTGSLTLRSTGGNIVFTDVADTIQTAGGAIELDAPLGSLTIGRLSTIGGGAAGDNIILTAGGGTMSFGALNAGTGIVSLNAGGNVTQSGAITAAGLAVVSSGSASMVIDLSTQNNAVTRFAADLSTVDSTNLAIVRFKAATTTNIDTVDGFNGVDLSNALTRRLVLSTAAGGSITQTQPIRASEVLLLGTNSTFSLTSVANAIGTIAGSQTPGDIAAATISVSDGLAIGSITDNSLTFNGLTLSGQLEIRGGQNLVSPTGQVTQSQPIAASDLVLVGPNANFTLNNAANAVSTLRTNATVASISLQNSQSLGVNAATTSAGTVNLSLGANQTLTINQAVTGSSVTLTADTLVIDDTNGLLRSTQPGTGTVRIQSASAGRTINVGGAPVVGDLNLEVADLLSRVDTNVGGGRLAIGGVNASGTLNLNEAFDYTLAGVEYTVVELGGGTLNLNAALTGTGKGLLLRLNGGDLTQSEPLIADALSLILDAAGTTDINVNLNTQANQFSTLFVQGLGAGTGARRVRVRDDDGFGMNGASLGTGANRLLSLQSDGSVTGTQTITANQLLLSGNAATFNLTAAGNNILNLAANITGAGSMHIVNSGTSGLTIASVDGTDGIIAANTKVLLTTSAGGISQSQPITVDTLLLDGSASVQTFNLSTQNNAVARLGVSMASTSTLRFRNDASFAVTSDVIDGVAISGLNVGTGAGSLIALRSNGTVTQDQPIVTAGLALSGDAGIFSLNTSANTLSTLATSSGASNTPSEVALQVGNSFAIGSVDSLTGVTSSGNVVLNLSGGSSVTQTGGAGISAGGLLLQSFVPATWDLTDSTNSFDVLAAALGAGSNVGIRNSSALQIGSILGTSGLTAVASDVAIQVDAGGMTQSNAVNVGKLVLVGDASAQTFDLSTQANIFGSFAASMADASTLRIRGTGGFIVDSIQVNLSAGNILRSGINLGTGTSVLSLQSTGGTITQTAAISTGGLALRGSSNFTLTDTANRWATVAGSLTGNNRQVLLGEGDGYQFATVDTLNGLNIGTTGSLLQLTGSGDITQSQSVITRTLNLLGGSSYTLSNAGNTFAILGATPTGDARSVNARSSTGFDVTGISSTGTGLQVTLTSGGAVTQSAPIVAQSLSLNGATATYILNNAANNAATLAITGAAATFFDLNALDVTAISAAGQSIALRGTGLTQSGAITAGSLNVTGSGPVTFDNAANAIGSLIGTGLSGNFSLRTTGNLSVTSLSTANGSVSIELVQAGATANVTGAVSNSGSANLITLTADDVNLTGSIASTGNVRIQPFTPGRAIGLGSPAGGDLNLSAAELLNVSAAGSTLVVGRDNGTGTITLGTLNLAALPYNIDLRGGTYSVPAGANVDASGKTLTLNISGGLNQDPTSSIKAQTLVLNGTGPVTLPGSNEVAALTGALAGGDLTLNNLVDLALGEIGGFSLAEAPFTINIQTANNLTITGNITNTSGGAIVLAAGTDGSGILSFSAAHTLRADNIALRAGRRDGTVSPGTANIDAATSAPLFRNGAGTANPNSLAISQDDAIALVTDFARLPVIATQFNGGVLNAMGYTLESFEGDVVMSAASIGSVVDSNLSLRTQVGNGRTIFDASPNVRSLAVTNDARFNADVTAPSIAVTGASQFVGTRVLTATAPESGAATLSLAAINGDAPQLVANEIALNGPVTSNSLTLIPLTSTAVRLGGADAGNAELHLSAAELLQIGNLVIFNVGSGSESIQLDSADLSTASYAINLLSGAIGVEPGATFDASGHGVTLISSGPVTQGAGSSVRTGALSLQATQAVTLDQAGNDFASVTGVADGVITLVDSNGFNVIGLLASNNLGGTFFDVSLQALTGAVNVNAGSEIRATGRTITLNSGGGSVIDGLVTTGVGTGGVGLLGGSTQAGTGLIRTGTLTLTGGNHTLNSLNQASTLTGSGTGSVNYSDDDDITLASFAGGSLILNTANAGVITLNGVINQSTSLTLNPTSGGVNQTGGTITTPILCLTGAGTHTINLPGNAIAQARGLFNGSLTLRTDANLDIGDAANELNSTGNPIQILAGGSINVFQRLSGSTITLDFGPGGLAQDTIGASQILGTTLALNGSGPVSLTSQTNAVSTLTTGAGSVGGALTYVDADALSVGSIISGPLSVAAGRSGNGNLSFAPGSALRADTMSFAAGDGTGGLGTTALVDMAANAPSFRNNAGSDRPTRVDVISDASIVDANTASAAQFGSVNAMDYRLTSRDGNISLDTSAKFAGSNLRVETTGLSVSTFNTGINLATFTSVGATLINGPFTVGTSGLMTFGGGVSIGGNAVTLAGNQIDFNGGDNSVSGTGGGSLTLLPFTPGNAIVLGGPGSADLSLSQTDLLALDNSLNSVVIGPNTGGGQLQLNLADLSGRNFLLTAQGGTVLVSDVFSAPNSTFTLRSTVGDISATGPGALRSANLVSFNAAGGVLLANAGNEFNQIEGVAFNGPFLATDADTAGDNLFTTGAGLASTGGSVSIRTAGGLRVGGLVSAFTPGQTLTLSSGTDGTGNLTFDAGAGINADTQAFVAGDGPGGSSTAIVDMLTNAPTFLSSGGVRPTRVDVTSDASITDANTADAVQFGDITALDYRLTSVEGDVNADTPSKFAGADVRTTTSGASSTRFNNSFQFNSLLVTGSTTFFADTSLTTLGTMSFLGPIAINTHAIVLTGAEIDFANAVSGAPVSSLALRQGIAGNAVELGGAPGTDQASTLDLTSADLSNLAAYAGGLAIGRSDGTGRILISGAVSRPAGGALSLVNTGAGGTIVVNAPVTNAGNLSLDSGAGTTLAANVSGRNVTISDDVTLTGDVAVANGGEVGHTTTITGTINSDSTPRALTFNGVAGSVNLNSAVGSLTPALRSLTINGATANLGGTVRTLAAQTYNATSNTILAADLTALNTTGGTITFNGPVTAGLDRTITANDTFQQNAAGTLAYSGNLVINAGAANLLAASNGGASFRVNAQNAVVVSGDIASTLSTFIASGLSGTGNLSFGAAGVRLDSPVLTLQAGNQLDAGSTASINALTSAPTFRGAGGVGVPTTFTLRQDAAITDANLPNGSQFNGGITPALSYNITSDNAGVTIATASKVNFTNVLTITSANGISLPAISVTRLVLNGVVGSGGDTTFQNDGGGSIDINGSQNFGAGNLTITADEINLAGAISGTGNVVLQPSSVALDTRIGGSELDSGLDLTTADISSLVDGFSSITIGRTNGTGTTRVVGATSFADNLVLRSNGATGSVVIDAPLSVSGPATTLAIDNTGGGTTLNADLTSSGGAITINDQTRIGAGLVTITSNGGAIRFQQSVDALNDAIQSLTLNAGGSSVIFDANIGALARLNTLISTGTSTTLVFANTSGDQTYNGSLITAGPATLTARDVSISGETSLGGDLAMNVRNLLAGAAPGTGRIFSTSAPAALTITNLPGGVNTFNADVGGLASQQLSTLNINAGSTSRFRANVRTTGAVNVAGTTLLDADTSIFSGSGGVNLAGVLGAHNLSISAAGGPVTLGTISGLGSGVGPALTSTGNGLTTFNGAGTLNSGVSIAGPAVINAPLTVSGGAASTFAGATTINGVVIASNSDVNFGDDAADALTINGPVDVQAGSAAVRVSGLVDGPGSLNVLGSAITFSRDVGSTSALASLSTNSSATSLRNATTSGTQTFNGTTSALALSASSLTNTGSLSAGSLTAAGATSNGSLNVATFATLGNAGLNSTGPTSIGGALTTAAGPVTILGDANLGSVTTNSGPLSITGATTLRSDVSTGGGLLSITGPITLAQTITLDSTASGAGGAGITLDGAVNSDSAATPRGLTIIGGAGNVVLTSPAGQVNPLASSVINGATTALNSVRTTGNQTYSSTKFLSGDLASTGAGTIALSGTTTLVGNVGLSTAGGTITSTGPIDSDAAATPRNLTFNAGSGLVEVTAAIGGTNPIGQTGFVGGIKRFNAIRSTGSQVHTGDTTFNADISSIGDPALGDGGVTIAGTPKLNTDLTVNASGNVDVSGTIASVGPRRILTLNGAQITTFGATLDSANPIRQLFSIGGGSTVFTVSSVTLPEQITVTDLAVVNQDTVFQAPNISLLGGIDGDGTAASLTPRSVTLLADPTSGIIQIGGTSGRVVNGTATLGRVLMGGIGALSANGIPTAAPSQTRMAGSLVAQGPIIFNGPLNLTGDTTLRTQSLVSREQAAANNSTEWGDILFRGRVNSADATAPAALALQTNTANNGVFSATNRLLAETPRIKLNAAVGTGEDAASAADDRPLRSLSVNESGRGGAPLMSTIVMAEGFNEVGELPVNLQPSSLLDVLVTESLVLGQGEKVLAFGNLRIRARGVGATPGRVELADVNVVGGTNASGSVAGSLAVLGDGGPVPVIAVRSRGAGSIVTQNNALASDGGADIVTGNTANFAVGPSIIGGLGVTSVASGSGGIATNPGALTTRTFEGGVSISNFQVFTANTAILERQTLGFFDLPASGPIETNVASSLAGAIPQAETGQVRQTATLSAGVFDDLRDMGVAVRLLTEDETVSLLTGRTLYNDFPTSRSDQLARGANPSPRVQSGDFQVAVNRLPTKPVEDALATYLSLAYTQDVDANGKLVRGKPRDTEMIQSMAAAWNAYLEQAQIPEDVDPDAREFGKWLCERGASGEATAEELIAMDALQKLAALFAQLEQIGLSPVEMSITQNAVLGKVKPREMDYQMLRDAIQGAGDMTRCSPPSQIAASRR